MQPTNPNAHTYVNGDDVKTPGNAVMQNTFLKQFITQSCTFKLYSVKCKVWSAERKVWSVKHGVETVKCRMLSVDCKVWSVECRV